MLEEKDIEDIRKEFPYIEETKNVYLDNSATTQKPLSVINSVSEYYTKYNGNPHSSIGVFAKASMEIFEKGREKVASFIGAEKNEIVFTKSATESANILAKNIPNISSTGEILITKFEHNSNIIPYKELEKSNFKTVFLPLNSDYTFNYEEFENMINSNTKVIALSLCSNVTGEDIDIFRLQEILEKKAEKGISPLVILDLSQSIGHKKINIKDFKFNIYGAFFSAHKMYGLQGLGILYMNKKYITRTLPMLYGGDMVEYITETESIYKESIEKYSGGTQNIGGVYALIHAIDFIEKIGIENIGKRYEDLTEYLITELRKNKRIKIYSLKSKSGIVSFSVENIHAHDIASYLSSKNISVRAGMQCAHILHNEMKITSSVRVSMGIYTTKKEIDIFLKELENAIKFFNI